MKKYYYYILLYTFFFEGMMSLKEDNSIVLYFVSYEHIIQYIFQLYINILQYMLDIIQINI